jgi:predicted ribosome quality control (RQC) complex YloA/Tae2 family protein
MVTHYFTLVALTRELDTLLRSSAIAEIFTQQKDELIIRVDRSPGTDLPQSRSSLHISVNPRLNYLFVEDQNSRARRNSVDLFEELTGSVVDRVSLLPFDRTLRFAFRDRRFLYVRLYDSAASNIYLTGEDLKILNAFKNRKKLQGTILRLDERKFDASILENPLPFRESLRNASPPLLFQALKAAVPVLGTVFAREALIRAGVGEDTPVRDLADEGLDRLHREVRGMIAAMEEGERREEGKTDGTYVYVRGATPVVLSAIPLRHLADMQPERFDSIHRAIKSFIGKTSRTRSSESEKDELFGAITKEIERGNRALNLARAAAAESWRAEEYERMGRLLMGNLHLVEKGAGWVDVSDPYLAGETVTVVLNPAFTPARNAEEYFGKAKKLRAALSETEKRIAQLEGKVNHFEEMLQRLDASRTDAEVAAFKKEYASGLKTTGLPEQSGGKEKLPFRTFEITGGFQVLVGKSSANNDLLTTRFAKPNDLWFHARGASGSHTVLKVQKGQQVPREAIREAACIAAYYSKMRKASNVPVAYCERKYVHKPRGAPAGTVTLEREEIVFVKPRLP